MLSLEGPGESSRARDLAWKPYSLFWYGDIHMLDDPKPQTLSTVLGSGALTCLSLWLFWIPLPTSLKVGEANVFPCKPASRLQWDRAIEWRSQCSVNRGLCSFGRGSFVLQLYTSPTWILWIWTGASFSTYALSCWKEETQVSKEEMSETGFPKMTQYIIFNSRKACLYFWDPEEKPSDFSQCQFPLVPWSSSLTKC